MTVFETVSWVQTVVIAGATVSALELLSLRLYYRPSFLLGAMTGTTTRAQSDETRASFFPLLAGLLAVRVLGGVALLIVPLDSLIRPGLLLLLVATTWYPALRQPYGFEGGDQLALITLVALLLQSLAPQDPGVATATCLFLAGQLVLSYLKSGWIKASHPSWRDGSFLDLLSKNEIYGHALLRRRFAVPARRIMGGRLLVAIEWGIPLSLLLPEIGFFIFAGLGLLFHLFNGVLLRITSFWWSTFALYPSLWVAWDVFHRLIPFLPR